MEPTEDWLSWEPPVPPPHPRTLHMAYRPPGARCQHSRQTTSGTNQEQLRVRCLQCDGHLAIVWVKHLSKENRDFIRRKLNLAEAPQLPPLPPTDATGAWEAAVERQRLLDQIKVYEDKIVMMEGKLLFETRPSRCGCCRRRR